MRDKPREWFKAAIVVSGCLMVSESYRFEMNQVHGIIVCHISIQIFEHKYVKTFEKWKNAGILNFANIEYY
jgi:hypothetical protein